MNAPSSKQEKNSILLVNLKTLRSNVRTILGELGDGVQLIPVLKGNAYGLGAGQVAKALSDFSEISLLAVSHVSEGLQLRREGIACQILVMGGILPFQIESAVREGLTLSCGRLSLAEEIAEAALKHDTLARIHLKIDTGLHRIGIEESELPQWIKEYRRCKDRVLLDGAFTHFAEPEDLLRCGEQFKIFLRALTKLEQEGIHVPLRHAAASATFECTDMFSLDAVRCGRRLYMDRPDAANGSIEEVASWRSYITNLKMRRKGDLIGYGEKTELDHDCLVATVGVGYGDGLNQDLIRVGAPVLAGGQRCRLLTCCMDQCMLDVSGTSCKVGDEVTFFGYDAEGCFLSSQEVAKMINNDEGCGLTTALTNRVERIYID